MRRRLLLAFAVMLVIGPPEAAWADVAIGFANPLSGPYALSGDRNRIAVEMAVRDVNEDGGVLDQKVTMIPADDACGLERSVAAARKLIAARVRLVVGHFCSHSSLLAAGLYETADVPMITPGSTHPRLTEEGRGNVFRLVGRDDRQGALAGDLLADRFGDERIAILHDGSTYGEGLAAETRRRLRARGVTEAVYDLYTPGEADYGALVSQLRRARADVLYLGGYGPDAGRIVRTARERGDALQVVGGDGLAMDEFWSVAREAGEGTIFSARPDVSALPEAAALLDRFEARGLGTRSGGLAAYAAVQVWTRAVELAGTFALDGVADALRRARFETVLGSVAFDDKGDLDGAAWKWWTWTDGAYVPLGQGGATQ